MDNLEFYVAPIINFPCILGFSWLSHLNPLINWNLKEVTVKKENEDEIILYAKSSNKLILNNLILFY